MLFRPEPRKKRSRLTSTRSFRRMILASENGSKLCKSKPVAYLLVWKSEKSGKEVDPRTLAPFSGPKLSPGSLDDCGRYVYDAGSH